MLEGLLSQVSLSTAANFLLAMGIALLAGLVIAAAYRFRNAGSEGFTVTLALLPMVVQVVIALVNGNVGAGVAVMGAFSLVRFRSAPGGAREIGSLFLAMAAGLAAGMGYLVLCVAVAALVSLAGLLLHAARFGEPRQRVQELKITIPESLDYTGAFDDLFARYLRTCELVSVRTTNMGSLFRLQYRVVLKSAGMEQGFSESSTQGAMLMNVSGAAGETLELVDEAGNVLASFTPAKAYSSVAITAPGLAAGQTYSLRIGGEEAASITMESTVYSEGGFGSFGGGRGGMRPGGKNGEMPTLPDMDEGESPLLPGESENERPTPPDGVAEEAEPAAEGETV